MGQPEQVTASEPRAGDPTPIAVVAYLVGYWLCVYLRVLPSVFTTEPYDCAFLAAVAAWLWWHGQRRDIKRYLIGRWVPRRRDLPAALLGLAMLGVWWAGVWYPMYWAGWLGGKRETLLSWEVVENVVTSPVVEEVVYRGVILGILSRHLRNRWVALALSSLLFAVVHGPTNLAYVVQLTGGGAILGWLFLRTGSVLPGVVGHAGFNLGINLVLLSQG
jgi:membrane protease YdiL (CAAX protease family)